MSTVAIDSTGCIVIDGQKVLPSGLSEAPPVGGKTPDGRDAWAEVASAGANFVRSGFRDWSLAQIDSQIATERGRMDAAAAHGMYCWPRLGNAGDLPTATGGQPSVPEQLLVRIANGLKTHPALGAYKGVDEPAWGGVAPAGLTRARTKLRTIDPDHPVVITQAPLGSVASLVPYRPAFDITGADIYPVAYPPGQHSDLPNKDISVVGDLTKKMVDAAGRHPAPRTVSRVTAEAGARQAAGRTGELRVRGGPAPPADPARQTALQVRTGAERQLQGLLRSARRARLPLQPRLAAVTDSLQLEALVGERELLHGDRGGFANRGSRWNS